MTETKPARVFDKLQGAIAELVQQGLLKSYAGDKEAYILAAAHLKANGSTVPSERSFRRHIARLRPLWRLHPRRHQARAHRQNEPGISHPAPPRHVRSRRLNHRPRPR